MLQVLGSAWPLLFGMGLLMLGNGMQGTLLGVRGGIEGFSTFEMSVVMSAYFLGFLGGSRLAPAMIRRVGHVRVFAALASATSAILVLYPLLATPAIWILGRAAIGFCFSGIYVTAESWLNNAADNDNRGKALSLYMLVQMTGIVSAQYLILVADPSGYAAFVIASIAVSLAVTPILLSISPTPAFDTTRPMSLRQLVTASPLGSVGMFLLGGVFAAQFGMSAVYASKLGLSLTQISTFVASFYVGALVLQYPLGWLSDRMDRRGLITAVAFAATAGSIAAGLFGTHYTVLLAAAFVIGGMTNPLYSLLLAHTNDFLDHEDMAAASGGLLFINGLGAIAGPLMIGWLMSDTVLGTQGYFGFLAALTLILGIYSAYRRTRRAAVPVDETGAYQAMSPTATPVAMELAQEVAIQAELEEDAPQPSTTM